MQRFVQWQHIEVRVDGEHLSNEAARQARQARAPVSGLRIDCFPGEIRIRGKVHKFLTVPFEVAIRRIEALPRNRLRIHLDRATAFGIPLPTLLVSLVEAKMPNLLRWDSVSNCLIADLDRILPSFVDAEIAAVDLVAGAVQVSLGAGGADLPPGLLEAHHVGEQHTV